MRMLNREYTYIYRGGLIHLATYVLRCLCLTTVMLHDHVKVTHILVIEAHELIVNV